VKEKNPIDEFFKRRLAEGTPAFNEAHWEAMEQLLGPKNRKFGFWFWLVPLFLALGVSVFGLNEWFEYKEANVQVKTGLLVEQDGLQESIDKSTVGINESDSSSKTVTSVSNKIKRHGTEELQLERSDLQQDLGVAKAKGPAKTTAFQGDLNTQEANNGKTSFSKSSNTADDGVVQSAEDKGNMGASISSANQPETPRFQNSGLGKSEAFKASVFMSLIDAESFVLSSPTRLKGKLISIEKFKPLHWRLSAFSTFGKYKVKESLTSSSDISISSEYAAPVSLLSQTVGVRLDYLKHGWVFSSGLSYTTIKEEVDFGVSDSTFLEFDYFEYQEIDSIIGSTIEVIDSVFVEEVWVIDTLFVNVQDTTYIWLVDSLGVYSYDQALAEERPYIQQASYVELPLLIGRRLPLGRGSFTLRTGPVIGFRSVVQGYYFASSNSDSDRPLMLSNRRDVSKSVVLNWQVEFEYAYQFSRRMSLGILVGDRRSLSSYFQNGGAKQGYKGQFVGLSFGYLL